MDNHIYLKPHGFTDNPRLVLNDSLILISPVKCRHKDNNDLKGTLICQVKVDGRMFNLVIWKNNGIPHVEYQNDVEVLKSTIVERKDWINSGDIYE